MTFRRTAPPFLMMLAVGLALATLGADAARGSANYGAVYFVDAQHGWYAGSSWSSDHGSYVVWATSNGGRTLKRQSAHMAAGMGVPRLAFTSRSSGLWASPLGVRFTRNGGVSWQETSSSQSLWIPRDIDLASAKVGWATGAYGSAGGGGRISRSTDGGKTWRSVKTARANDGTQFGGLSCPTAQRCYVLGSGRWRGLWATSDAGKHWVKRMLPGSTWFTSVDFPTSLTGWVVGWNGTVLKTTNGGVTWTRQNQEGDQQLSEVCFTDASHGWVVGAEGVILHTDNGGEQWTEQASGTTSGLEDVCFVDRLRGWVVGMGSRLRTTDGGETWKKL